MQKITSDSEIEQVMKRIGVGEGEELRESEKRSSTLEKFAQLRSRNPRVTLNLKDTNTAFVSVDKDGVDEFKDIVVPTKKFKQQVTGLPDDYFDYLLQRAFTVHECGHVLYSSYPALREYSDFVREEEDTDTETYVNMFQHFFNALEDGAIEEYLRQSFLVEEELHALRATLHENENHYMGREYSVEDRTEYHYPFFHAVMVACLNIGIYDNGELDKLLDENNDKHFFAKRGGEQMEDMFKQSVLPRIQKDIPKIQEETDARERARLCYELWDYIRDYIKRSTTPGKTEWKRDMENQKGNSYAPGVPENISKGHGGQEGEPIAIVSSEGDDEPTPGQGNIDSESMEEKAKGGIRSETEQQGGDWSEELEQIVNSLQGGDGVDEIAIAEGGEVNTTRKNTAKKLGKRCERIFQRRLKELRRDREKIGQRRGKLDSRRMVQADRGSTKIFKRTEEGNDKNYSCTLVVDRSGSMSGRIDDVELAVGAIAYGLEENGVDTCILDTHNSMTTLSKPFGSEVDYHTDTLFSNRVGGGTPLTYTMQFARQRIGEGAGDNPFAIVITDGAPRDTEAFKKEVRNANFPVLGLYLTHGMSGVEDQLSLYDRAIAVSSDEDVGSKITHLINGVMF